MTTITDTFRDPSGNGVGGVTVRATLVAASEVLTGGGAIIREAETTTASDGTWSLTLTPLSSLAVSEGAYYLIMADGHRWTIDVPDSGTYGLADVQVEPAPLPPTGATTAALAAHVGDTTDVHGIDDTAALTHAATSIAAGSYLRGVDGDRGVEGRTPAQVLADIGAATPAEIQAAIAALSSVYLALTGGELTGPLSIVDAFTVESPGNPQFRLQPGGTSDVFDVDFAGANVWHSVYDGDDPDGFTGDRYQYMVVRRTADFPSVQMCGRWESRPAPFGPEVHTIHPAEGWAGFGGKNELSQIRLCGFKTTPGAPTSGTWATGDVILDSAGLWWLCTAGGTPGAWVSSNLDQTTTGVAVLDRWRSTANSVSLGPSGMMRLSYFTAPRSETWTKIVAVSGNTAAGATPTLCRMGVYSVAANGDLTLAAACANDTALFADMNTRYVRDLTSPLTVVGGQRYAFGVLVVSGATLPTFAGITGTSATSDVWNSLTPRLTGAVSGLSDLPTFVNAGAITGVGSAVYGELLP